jgi:hypothetical protein
MIFLIAACSFGTQRSRHLQRSDTRYSHAETKLIGERLAARFLFIAEIGIALLQSIATSLILAGAVALTSSTVLAQHQFSGHWSVEVVTEKGICDRAYRYPVVIENGAVRSSGPQSFNVSGRVQPNGRIQSSIQHDMTRADVTGRLAGRSGSGTWITSGAVSCSGRWNAKRQS